MSNCLVLQGKNFIAIGADTASSILIDGKYKRFNNNAKKIFRFGNEIMFCSGKMNLVELVTSNICIKNYKIDLNNLINFIKSIKIQKSDSYDLEILICGVNENKSYIHQISQYNNFEINTIINNKEEYSIYSTGFNAKFMLNTAKNNYKLCKSISDLFIKSFMDISCEEVGGYINMYLIEENKITKCISDKKIDDIKPIFINSNDIHYVIADTLVGDVIAGETLLISNESGTFTVDKDGIVVYNMKLDLMSDDTRLLIDPKLKSLFNIYNLKEKKQTFYIDNNGNLSMLGNLYINNNNIYCKIDMESENIIEVGRGTIIDAGNEGESSKEENVNTEVIDTSSPNVKKMEWVKNIENISSISADKNWTSDISTSKITQGNLTTKNGNIYILQEVDSYSKVIKKFNKDNNNWDVITDLYIFDIDCLKNYNLLLIKL